MTTASTLSIFQAPHVMIDEDVEEKAFKDFRGQKLAVLKPKLEKKRDELQKIVDECTDEEGKNFDIMQSQTLSGNMAEKVETLLKMNSEHAGMMRAAQEAAALEGMNQDIRRRNLGGSAVDPVNVIVQPGPRSDFYDRLLEQVHENYGTEDSLGRLVSSQRLNVSFDFSGPDMYQALFKRDQGTGYPPETPMTHLVTLMPQAPNRLIDIVPVINVSLPSFKYKEETTFDNKAARRAEGGDTAESALGLTDRDAIIESISTYIPVTEEQLEDSDMARAYVNQRLMFMLRQTLDVQIANGAGGANNFLGFKNVPNIPSQEIPTEGPNNSKTAVKPMNHIKRAMTKVELDGESIADNAVLHHTIWDDIALSETTAGGYYLGNPMGNFAERIWGLPVVKSSRFEDNFNTDGNKVGMVGDFRNHSNLLLKKDFTIDTGLIGDDFKKHQVSLRATVRAQLVVYRPVAYCFLAADV